MKQNYVSGFAPSRTAAGHRTAMGRLLLITLLLFTFIGGAKAQVSIPYTEGFEDMSTVSDLNNAGWELLYQSSSTSASFLAINTSSSNASAGSQSLNIDSWDAASSDYVVIVGLPLITNKALNELQITFSYKVMNTSVAIGYLTDANDASTFASVQSYNGSSNFTTKTVELNTVPTTAVRIAIKYTGYYRCYVDDVKVEQLPTCFQPQNLTASNLTHNSATLTWQRHTGGTENDWVLEYGTASDFSNATSVTVTGGTPSKDLTGLAATTTYYARVKADCTGNDYSEWCATKSFTTTAQAAAVGESWSDNFEGASCDWDLINGTLTNKWAWGTAANNGGTHGLYISNDGGTNNTYSIESAAMVYATKLLTFTEGKFEFAYDWKANGESTYDYLRVALVPASVTLTAGTTPSGFSYSGLPTGWIALDGGSKLNLATTWQSKSVAVNMTAGNYYLVMAWKNDNGVGAQPPAAVDNVSITRLACPYDVTDLAVSNITTTGAILTWTAGEAEQWQVAYSTNSTFEGATEKIVSAATYTMTGLTTATTYYVKVRAYCGGTDFGSWSSVVSFPTACEAMDLSTVDFSENFDDYSAVSASTPTERILPICWNAINNCSYSSYKYYPVVSSYSSSSYANSGSNYLKFYSVYSSYTDYDPQPQYAILPAMENMEGKQITLWARGNNASSTFKIGMMTDPADASTFEMIDEKTLTTSYEEYSFILGEGNYVAIMMEAANSSTTTKGVYIDDITIADAPTCLKPSDLTFESATTTGATFSWTNGAEGQTAWQIAYSTDPTFDPNEVTPVDVTSNPGTIDGLTAATMYYAYVRANCGNNDYSDWSTTYVTFTTTCESVTITENDIFTEGFEDYTGTTYNSNGVVPPCWDSYTTGSVAPHIIGTGSYYYHHEGTNALTFYGSGYCYAAMPEFTNAISELQIRFWMQTESSTNGALVLGYITDEDENYSTFTEIETYANNYGSMVQRITYLNEVPSEATRLVFRWYYDNQYSCCIDDVEVSLIPSCIDPSDLEVTATTITTATLSWTENGSATAWQIMLNDDENNLILADANPFTLEGLTGSTNYTVKVRAYCAADDQSAWTSSVRFATACAGPITITAATPYTQNFESPVVTTGYNEIGEMPSCWDNYPVGGAASAKILAAGATYNYAESGQVLYFYGNGNNYAALPEFNNPLNTLYISFKYATESSTNGTLTLGYITDEDEDYNTFTAIEGGTFNASSASDDTFVDVDPISLSALPANATRLVFRWTYTGQWGCNVDDVQVALINNITLADNAANSTTISNNNGQLANVTLSDRKLFKDESWNTLCLPFDLTLDGSPLDGAEALELSSASIEGNTLTLTFSNPVDELVAGTPYIIKWDSGDDLTEADLVFNGVTISDEINNFNSGSGETRVRFLGTYDFISFDDEDFIEDTSILFLGDANKLYYPVKGASIGAFRAYFKIGEDGSPARLLTNFKFGFGSEAESQGIHSIEDGSGNETGAWYDLQGRKLDNVGAVVGNASQRNISTPAHLRKGVYLHNGRKVVVK